MMVGCRTGRMEVKTTVKVVQYMAVNWAVLTKAGTRAGQLFAMAAQ